MRPTLVICYGTQTGCARDVAELVAREAQRRHIDTRLLNLRDVTRDALAADATLELPDAPPTFHVFVVSTTGQGDTPDEMVPFWRSLLLRSLAADTMAGLQYSVFGLGDSGYARYNWVGKKLWKRLSQLGATAFHPRGEGDDQHRLGLDGGLDAWLRGLWAFFDAQFPLPDGLEPIPADVLPPSRYTVVSLDDTSAAAHAPPPSPFATAKVVANARVTAPSHFQDVRHLRLEVPDPAASLGYAPGDVLQVLPSNMPFLVDAMVAALGISDEDADAPIVIQANPEATGLSEDALRAPFLSQPTTIRRVLTHHLDLTSPPRRYFFQLLAAFAEPTEDGAMMAERLLEFASAEGQEALYDYANRDHRSVPEVLADFRWCHPPFEYLLDMLQVIQPRSFSIASAPARAPSGCLPVDLLMAVVTYETRIKTRPRHGLCSTWLAHRDPGDHVPVRFAKGTMTLPSKPTTPLIIIGPGTGIAPFRAILESRHGPALVDPAAAAPPPPVPDLVYTGNRHRHADYLFGDELEAWAARGAIVLRSAFSRDTEDKEYVQHLLEADGARVWDWLVTHRAVILLSGNAKNMPDAVRRALARVFVAQGAAPDQDAGLVLLDKMESTGRFSRECWF